MWPPSNIWGTPQIWIWPPSYIWGTPQIWIWPPQLHLRYTPDLDLAPLRYQLGWAYPLGGTRLTPLVDPREDLSKKSTVAGTSPREKAVFWGEGVPGALLQMDHRRVLLRTK